MQIKKWSLSAFNSLADAVNTSSCRLTVLLAVLQGGLVDGLTDEGGGTLW